MWRFIAAIVFAVSAWAEESTRTAMLEANQQAMAAQNAGEYELGEMKYRRALRLAVAEEDRTALRANMATLHLDRGEFETAAKLWRQVIAKSDSGEAWNGLAIALQGLRRFDEAEAAYTRSLTLLPASGLLQARTRFNRATLYWQRGLRIEAMSEVEALLPQMAEDGALKGLALTQAGAMALEYGDARRAEDWLGEAARLLAAHGIQKPEVQAGILRLRANAMRALGEHGQAKRYRREAEAMTRPRADVGISLERLRNENR